LDGLDEVVLDMWEWAYVDGDMFVKEIYYRITFVAAKQVSIALMVVAWKVPLSMGFTSSCV
jgi:hypothetical protein